MERRHYTDSAVSVRMLDNGNAVLEGYGVVFGGKDTYGETFTVDTDFMLDYVPVKAMFYDHTLRDEPELSDPTKPIGRVIKMTPDERGLWVQAEVDKANKYYEAILEFVRTGKAGFSSGSAGHLVRVDTDSISQTRTIRRWPIVELSLTPTPAEPRTRGVQRTKSATEAEQDAPQDSEAETQAVAASQPRIEVLADSSNTGESIMPDQDMASLEAKFASLEALSRKTSDQLDALINAAETSPSPVKGLPIVSTTGGTTDSGIKSFGDWLVAVKRGDTERIERHYGSAYKTLETDSGTTGGYTLPSAFSTQIQTLTYEQENWLASLNRVNVSDLSGSWPVLDVTFTPTAGVGETAAAGRMKGVARVESSAYTETEPQFQSLTWRVWDVISGIVPMSVEMKRANGAVLESLLKTTIATLDAAKQAYYFLRGTGVGMPLGILNSPALITQGAASANVIGRTDLTNMITKFRPFNGGFWLGHRTNLPDIANLETAAGGSVYMANLNITPGEMPLYGYPIRWTEHLPVTDTTGSWMLVAPGAYQVWDGGMFIDYSEHRYFEQGRVAWRFSHPLDGQPIIRGTIKQGNPGTAHQVSPFVSFTFA